MPKLKFGIQRSLISLGILSIFILVVTFSKFNSFKSFLVPNSFCNIQEKSYYHDNDNGNNNDQSMTGIQAKQTLEIVINKIQIQIDEIRAISSEQSEPLKYHSFLADILGLIESVHESLPTNETGRFLPSKQQSPGVDPDEHFIIEELQKYARPKPNRLGRSNFMGANATFTSIGHACFAMRAELEEYMRYDVGDVCEDDWRLAQRLMVHGCDPLPRRRCLARAPRLYAAPLPLPRALWAAPDDRNVRWSHYRCKSFACLASNASTPKGFSKCLDCFDLAGGERLRWLAPGNSSAEFSVGEVLAIKPGQVRIGLDFSVGTGTFAARMRDHNVTIVTAAMNLGAPFSETIALRGLVPLYLTVNQRLPFFDNALDMIHTARFLDGWIDLVLLEFVLYDWDRVLRPGGLLWIDGFFCLKEDLEDYLECFKALRYKKHKWVVAPKLDKDDREVYFSAVLEKPPRPFR